MSNYCDICEEIAHDLKYINKDQIAVLLMLISELPWSNMKRRVCSKCLKTIDLIINFRERCLVLNTVRHERFESTIQFEEITETIEIDYPSDSEATDSKTVEKTQQTNDCSSVVRGKTGRRYTRLCPHCGKRFKSTQINRHINIHLNKRPHICSVCGKGYNSDTTLRSHTVGVHGNPSEWKHVCDYCGKRFWRRSGLLLHVKRHTGEKRFLCSRCGKAFCDKITLETHKAAHTDEKMFECTLCGYCYKHAASLRVHRRKVHKLGKEIKSQTFMCHVCPKQYTTRGALNRHANNCHLLQERYEKC